MSGSIDPTGLKLKEMFFSKGSLLTGQEFPDRYFQQDRLSVRSRSVAKNTGTPPGTRKAHGRRRSAVGIQTDMEDFEMNGSSEADYLQELSSRHDEVMLKLDELEQKISSVLDEYLGKVETSASEIHSELVRIGAESSVEL